MSNSKFDPRIAFKGHDPAEIIRAAAKDMWQRGWANTERRERQALQYKYQTAPCLEIEVTQLSDNPPLWEASTTQDFLQEMRRGGVIGSGKLVVRERERRHLIAEMKYQGRLALQKYHHLSEAEAKSRMANVRIEERGLVLLADSERYAGERRR